MTDPKTPKEREKGALQGPERRKVLRSAALRPLNIMTLVAGLGISATTGLWWIVPLTVVIYASVVYLASRDPLFARRALEGRGVSAVRSPVRDISPERRARWLPRGETREQVEAALVTYRKALSAIEGSDEVTQLVLEGAVPKLHEAAERLVDVARRREQAAGTLEDFRPGQTGSEEARSQRHDSLEQLQTHVRKADEEISTISNQFLTIRAQAVRASIDRTGSSQQAELLESSLDELNFRLEALNETFSDPDEDRGPR